MNDLAVLTRTRVEFDPSTPVIGAEVHGVDLRADLDEETVAALRQGLLRYKVLFLRDQPITDEQQIRFSRYFGAVTPGHPVSDSQKERLEIKENVKTRRNDFRSSAPDSDVTRRLRRNHRYISRGWHTDITFVANPASVSFLRGVEIPPVGGDTLWVNLEAAYAGLSPSFQNLVDGLQAVHGISERPPGYEAPARRDGREPGPFASVHPLVRVHPETGKKSLFISPGFIRYIVGLKDGESEALLDYLIRETVSRADYQVRFRWTQDALAIWDNRSTAHVGPIDAEHFKDERVVRRTTVGGDLPVGPDGFVSKPIIGELFNVIS